jgi:putative RNA 2'-phosphotransferase
MSFDEKERVKLSKTLSYMLRHAPEEFGLLVDPEGYAPMEEVIEALRRKRPSVTRAQLEEVVTGCEKGRFEIVDGEIRACYGHTLEGKIDYEPVEPPEVLFHGTANRFLDSIRKMGLRPMGRQYVHLTVRRDFARTVGRRRDRSPTILVVEALRAHQDGIVFYKANEDFYLADLVPSAYIRF